MPKKVQVVVGPGQELCRQILSPRAKAKLESFAEVIWNEGEKPLTAEQWAARLPGAWGAITGWGTPHFDAGILAGADQLRIVGHSAGTVKPIFFPEVFDRGIKVVNSAATIADSVAEFTLLMMLSQLRDVHRYDLAMKGAEPWPKRSGSRELYGKRVGIISASLVGRRVCKLLKPFHTQTLVYDPYLPVEQAKKLGVKLASLEEIMSTCDVVSVHAPVTEETTGMISAKYLKMIKPGTVFVNNARAAVIDYDALTKELADGRFRAALDVFPQEPLAVDSPLRKMPNVFLTPHTAGFAVESYMRLIETVVDDLARFLAGKPLRNEVLKERIRILA
jgi:phosphoglycerate dehydrogenase-like enzyme